MSSVLVMLCYAMMGSIAGAFMRPCLTRTCESVLERVRCRLSVLQSHVRCGNDQRVPTIADSDTEEHFPDGFDTPWNKNFH